MSVASVPPAPILSPAEMQVLVARTGLTLNPGQMADLVLVWRQLAGLIALLPRERPLADDQAFAFRLPPPAAAAAAAATRTARPRTGRPRAAASRVLARPARAAQKGGKAAAAEAARTPGPKRPASGGPARSPRPKPPGKPTRPRR
jgi:hypothetical protein